MNNRGCQVILLSITHYRKMKVSHYFPQRLVVTRLHRHFVPIIQRAHKKRLKWLIDTQGWPVVLHQDSPCSSQKTSRYRSENSLRFPFFMAIIIFQKNLRFEFGLINSVMLQNLTLSEYKYHLNVASRLRITA